MSYDIVCQWYLYLWERMLSFPEHFRINLEGKTITFLVPKFTCPLTSRNARRLFHSTSHEVLDAQTVKRLSAAGLISTPFHHRQSRWVLHHVGRQLMTISATGITKRLSAWVSTQAVIHGVAAVDNMDVNQVLLFCDE